MNVEDLMRRWFERLEPGASVLDAARLMIFTRQQALPVVEGDRLVGMIAERDIFHRLLDELSGDVYWSLLSVDSDAVGGYRRVGGLRIAELMTTRLVTVTPDMLALHALGVMQARRIQRLPVIEGEKVVGLIFQTDIHEALFNASIHHKPE